MFDVVLTGGTVLDGADGPPALADVGVRDGRIAAVGRLGDAATSLRIDVTGRYVAPGFVDTHSHADAAVLDPAVQLASLRQGVTTVVLGQDGLSYAPATPAALAFVHRYFAAINGTHPGLDAGPVSVAELRATWHTRTALNTAYLIPHGTVRFSVLGGAPGPADPEALAAMIRLVEAGLTDGAVGVSTGLEYLPGRYADVVEVAALCRPLAASGLPYVTHMRGYGEAASAGLPEAEAIATAAGVALHVSHYHGPGGLLVALLDNALARGVDISIDTYPYRRGCTILAMAALPRWLDDTDLDRAGAALADPATRARVRAGLNPQLWPRITFAHVPSSRWAWVEGLTLPAAAARAGLDAGDMLLDVLGATGLTASAVIEAPASTDEDAVRALLRHPAQTGGSDGIFIGGHPHPRGWGAFARFLRRHVVELADWTWPEAVTHLAARPARRFGLRDRGYVRAGLAADLIVIDPARVADRATYDEPRRLAEGVDDVLVGGVAVLRGGALTGAQPGAALTPG